MSTTQGESVRLLRNMTESKFVKSIDYAYGNRKNDIYVYEIMKRYQDVE